MEEKFMFLWNKIVDNKTTVVKIGSTVLGALIGLAVATVVNDIQTSENDQLVKDILSDD